MKNITVKELIEQLQKLPPDMMIIIMERYVGTSLRKNMKRAIAINRISF